LSTLFLDTSYNQTIGLLDERGQWLRKRQLTGQRSSSVLHHELHEMLKEAAIAPQGIQRVFYVAGPGFYTGLRISHGMADMLRLLGCELMNIYNFEIPAVLGEQDYVWVTKAYRGEVFIYTSKDKQAKLISEKDFLAMSWSGEVYIHHKSALDQNMLQRLSSSKETEAMLLSNMPQVFSWAKQQSGLRELYYFRPPEEEFKPSV
jgi:tRNA A37 threonylcarbamoyladenosine modification protein TsaB